MSKQILEKVLEHILNKEEDKASDLLHTYFVEKGRGIYEALIQSDELAEDEVFSEDDSDIEDDMQHDFADDIAAKKDEIDAEEMFSEDEELPLEDDDFANADEESEEEGEEKEEDEAEEKEQADLSAMQDAVLDVEDALDELKSLFAELQADQDVEDEIKESAELLAVAKPAPGTDDRSAKSPVRANDFEGGAEPFEMGVDEDEEGGEADFEDMDIDSGNRAGQKTAPDMRQVKAPAKPMQASGRSPIAGK